MGQGGPVRDQSSLFASLEDVATKIEDAIGDKGRAHLKAIDACFFSWEKFAWTKAAPEVLWPLVDAIGAQKLCVVTYRGPQSEAKPKRFRVLPLRLFVHQGAVYLHAWTQRFDSIVTLNLHRLEHLDVLAETAPIPKGYSTDEFEQSAFGIFTGTAPADYRLRFTKMVAPYIRERVWHPTQKISEKKDGVIELTFRCAESYEVLAWIASWRDQVELLEPKRVRTTMRALSEWMGVTYREK